MPVAFFVSITRHSHLVDLLVTAVLLLLLPQFGFAQEEVSAEFSIAVDNVRSPTECTRTGWSISYDRTPDFADYGTRDLNFYFVQYVNGDLNFVHYWGSGYDAYVQDYWVSNDIRGTRARTIGSYTVPLFTDTYQAESIDYVLYGDEVIWEIRATLTCEAGEVVEYDLTSEPVQSTRDALPEFTGNLVLTLQDIPLYGNTFRRTNYLGKIEACQTFFVSRIRLPRASILVWARESITGHDIPLFDGTTHLRIVDVPENYGQPDGQPILDECAAES